MSGFLIVALMLLLTVTAYLLLPLLVPRAPQGGSTQSPALVVLREQRRELDAELAAGRITAASHAESLAELEARAAAEMQAIEAPVTQRPARAWAVAVGLFLPAAAIALYLLLGQPAGLDPANTVAPATASTAEVARMVDGLAEKVRQHPEDLEAAQMLARSYMVLERFQDAVAVFEQLAPRMPDNAQFYADWADALASANGNSMQGRPAELVARALAFDPDNVKALALAGGLAFERHDYREAQKLWTRMTGHVDPASELGRSAQAMLDEVARRLGETPAAAAPAGEPSLAGQISLAPALRDAVKPGDAVFVFVRPAAGGPPFAALRLEVGQWPLRFDFAGAQRMGEAGTGPWVVGARVSRSGNATPASGDPEGFSQEVVGTSRELRIEIDRRRP